MREISPATNLSAEDFFQNMPDFTRAIVLKIREQKNNASRPRPSEYLVDKSGILTSPKRLALLDKVAMLVDENLCGRSEMCEQFSSLLALSLKYLGIDAHAVGGDAIYFDENHKEIYRWKHVWVRAGDEVIDGNSDSLIENPAVPKEVSAPPYWGPIKLTPRDRRLRSETGAIIADHDVTTIWWPDLKIWLDTDSSGV